MEPNRLTLMVAAVAAQLQPLQALAQQTQPGTGPPQSPWDWPGPWHMWNGGWGFGWLVPLFMLLMFAMCLAVFLRGPGARCGRHRHAASPPTTDGQSAVGDAGEDPARSALRILNERFANGEIPKQDYEEKKAAIVSASPR